MVDNTNRMIEPSEYVDTVDNIINNADSELMTIANDVSNFKYLNEIYGTEEGDKFIEAMREFFYVNNPACIIGSRSGCDQFRGVFSMEGMTREEKIEKVIDMNTRFEAMMNEKYPHVYIHVYTGMYFVDKEKDNGRIAVDRAHQAKKQIKGRFDVKCHVYSDKDLHMLREKMDVTNMFAHACEDDRILMYIQPKYSVSKDKVIGGEALCRILGEDGNLIMPARFISVLEETGMITKLDEIMIEKVYALQRKLIDEGKEILPVSVNVSRLEFSNPGFADFAIGLQKKYEIPPRYMEFEILEDTLIIGMEEITNNIHRLREYGFKVSVDDFGSGCSSLNQIASIPVDIIKLDRIFATNSIGNEKGKVVVKNLIKLLRDINFDIVFEGIETEEQKNVAYEFGCDVIQGYLYGKPMAYEEFLEKYIY